MLDWSVRKLLIDSGWMLRRLCLLAIVVCALTPAAFLAWTFRTMPQFGFYHDDSIYWVSAKSLADGNSYRIESLPGQPYQTKYPPLYPALLSLIWRLAPEFPSNLRLATLVAWLLFPVWLLTVWAFLREHSLEPWEQWSLLVAAAINPIAAVFSFSLMPELPTVAEAGLPGFELTPWYGVMTRAGCAAARRDSVSRSR